MVDPLGARATTTYVREPGGMVFGVVSMVALYGPTLGRAVWGGTAVRTT